MNDQSTQQGEVGRPFLVLANVVAMVALGVGFSVWLLRFTDWFPLVGGLLALTGAFSWIAFMSNIISDARKQQAQKFLDRAILQKGATLTVIGVIAAVFVFAYPMRHGTVLIDTLGDTRGRTGTIQADSDPPQRISVTAGQVQLFLVKAPLFGHINYRVKLTGLPALTVAMRPWRRTRLITPGDFWTAPVLLVRPTITMSGEALHGEFELIVRVNNTDWGKASPYFGNTVWLGVSEDVEIPEARVQRWRLEFLREGHDPVLAHRWTTPVSVVGNPVLVAGDEVIVNIVRIGDPTGIQGVAATRVRPSQSASTFPQELVIDVNG